MVSPRCFEYSCCRNHCFCIGWNHVVDTDCRISDEHRCGENKPALDTGNGTRRYELSPRYECFGGESELLLRFHLEHCTVLRNRNNAVLFAVGSAR